VNDEDADVVGNNIMVSTEHDLISNHYSYGRGEAIV